MTEDEMVGWHHQLDGYEQVLEDGEGQGRLVCCSPRDCKEMDVTEQWDDSSTPSLSCPLPSGHFS